VSDLESAVREIDVGGSRDPNTTTTGDDARNDADVAVDEATESHRAAEGAETSSSLTSRDGLKNALLRTSPDTPLSRVESPWNPEEGGVTRIYRGLQKMLDFAGTPAIVDLVVGTIEAMQTFEPDGGEEPDADGDDVVAGVDEDDPVIA